MEQGAHSKFHETMTMELLTFFFLLFLLVTLWYSYIQEFFEGGRRKGKCMKGFERVIRNEVYSQSGENL